MLKSVAIVAFLFAASLSAQNADLALGKRLFESQCALCHGQNGTGGRGPALNRPKPDKAPNDAAIEKVISEGIPPEMPGAWQLSKREVSSVASYVRSIGSFTPDPLPGDAAHGASLYRSNGCSGCHIVHGEGSGFGPELSSIGARRNAAHLRQSLNEPAAFIPEDAVAVEATTSTGTRISGLRANEDTFSVQIKTLEGRFHSLRKAELKSMRKMSGQSLMPSYAGKLTATELDDLVAYLASLRGRP